MKIAPVTSYSELPKQVVDLVHSTLTMLVTIVTYPIFKVLEFCGCVKTRSLAAVKIPTITEFYLGARNDKGVTLEEIWAFDDATKEAKHDFIQWLFPIKSIGMNPSAPPTNAATINAFKSDKALQEKMRKSFEVMLEFYGLEYGFLGRIKQASNFSTQAQNWLNPGNHNFLRITRILTSLRLHGLETEAKAFFKVLQEIYKAYPNQISPETFSYWQNTTS